MSARLGYRWFSAGCLLFGLSPAPGAQAQEVPRERFAEELQVTEVLLDVLVTDSRDRVILGLGPEDFRVIEDGRPMEISGSTFYSSRRLLSTSEKSELERAGAAIDEAPQERTFILLFHDQRRSGTGLAVRQLEAGREARRWVERELGPRDVAAVVGYDLKLEVYQDLTGEREALAAALGRAAQGLGAGGNWPSRAGALQGPSLLAGMPAGDELRDATGTVYEALEVLSRAAGSVPGRKILFYFGRGFGRLDERGRNDPELPWLERALQVLNDNNVAVYPVDLSPSGARHSFESTLQRLAADTGGEYLRYFTSFITPLTRVAELNSGYYLLSYSRRRPRGESGYQRVKVETINPEFKLRARQGYLYGQESSARRRASGQEPADPLQ